MTYIDSRRKVLSHLDRLAAWQKGERAAPVTVEWDLSNRCPLGCMDCHFAHTHSRGPWTVKERLLPMAFDPCGDLADVDVVKRVLGEMAEAGVLSVVWSGGGEPTSHPQWLDIMRYAARLGFQQGMYTSGGLLKPAQAKELAELATWVVVSLDCKDAETYAKEKGVPAWRFDAACAGLVELAKEQDATIGASFLLHGENWQDAPEMLMFARTLGAHYTTFRPAIRTSPATPAVCEDNRSWITEALPMLRDLAKRRQGVELDADRFAEYRDWHGRSYKMCYGVRMTANITPDSRMWLCPQRRGVTCLGDLREESFAEVWRRHPGQWTDFSSCRVMCRLHLMNQTLDEVFSSREHGAFM